MAHEKLEDLRSAMKYETTYPNPVRGTSFSYNWSSYQYRLKIQNISFNYKYIHLSAVSEKY